MHLLRTLCLALSFFICVACASGPVQERPPKQLRKSTRYLNKGVRLYTKGCFPQALKQFRKAHESYAAVDHLQGTAASLNSLANTYYRLDEVDGALTIYNEAIEIYRLLDDHTGLVRAMTSKAAALVASGQLDAAATALKEADEMAENNGALAGLRLKTRGILLMHRNEISSAEKVLKKALDATPAVTGSQYSALQYAMGHLLMTSKRPAKAIPYFDAALVADRKVGAYHGIAQDLAAIGACQAQLGFHDQSVIAYKRSIKLYALLADASAVAQIRTELENSAHSAGTDIQGVLRWVDKWLAGEREENICR